MLNRIRTAIILALLGAATAAGTGEAASAGGPFMRGYAATVFKKELSTAETAIEDALAVYNTDLVKCRYHLSIAIHALEESSRLYEKGSGQAELVKAAAEYLTAVYYHLGSRLDAGYEPSAQEIEWETATIRRIAADVSSLLGEEEEQPAAPAVDYEGLREEVKNNEAAGKGDVEAQIEALRVEAARLNEEAAEVEAENSILAGKMMKVIDVVNFWKNCIGEDQAFWPYR